MLEPSFALVRRHEQDQHRAEAENELKLQKQLEQFWLRIARLETHAQESDPAKAALECLLQDFRQDKVALQDRVQKLEDDVAHLRRHSEQIELDKAALAHRVEELENDHRQTECNSTSPETETSSVRSTPNVTAGGQEVDHHPTVGLDPVKLHPTLPRVLFVVDPEKSKLADDSEFPLNLISTLRLLLIAAMGNGNIDTTRLRSLRSVSDNAFTRKDKCLYRYLESSSSHQTKSVWTRDHRHFYACRTCVNKRRLCMSISQGQALVLPLHPLFRIANGHDGALNGEGSDMGKSGSEVNSTELQYWVAARGMLTKHAPYNADVWSVPSTF